MSRRSIFLLAAAVVLLYFSIILFMLSPLHGTKGVYYGSSYMNHLSLRQVPNVNWCKELHYRSPPSTNVVALVSYPGSGNTWLRYLLQQVTGIMTGSIYMDYGLRVHGFPAENVTDGSVLVVKTHEAPPLEHNKFTSAILLIRNPRDAILLSNCQPVNTLVTFQLILNVYRLHALEYGDMKNRHVSSIFCVMADFNRLHKGHIGTAPKSAFEKKLPDSKKSEWSSYVWSQVAVWETLHALWLTRFGGALLVVRYEALVAAPEHTLAGLLRFLRHNYTEADMKCAMANKEGIYRRRKKLEDFDPFTPEMYRSLNVVRNKVLRMITSYRIRKRKEEEQHLQGQVTTYNNV